MGIMLMDYGATFNNIGFGQSLMFDRIEPRVMYHSGVVLCYSSFLTISFLCLYLMKSLPRQRTREREVEG
jgi:hypothetical protein